MMKARLVFYLNATLTDEQRRRLNQEFRNDEEMWKWLRQDANLAKMRLNEEICFLKWDKRQQQFYSTEGNGELYKFTPDGFELPYFMIGSETKITEVRAVVYFQTKGDLVCGQYSKNDIRGMLDFEWLPDGRPQYVLIVHGARTLEKLNSFVFAVRNGLDPDSTWK